MTHRRLCILAAGLSLAALAAGTAQAQSAGADRRLDRMERDLRTLQSIVMQAQATGQPVVVKPEGPDPAVGALEARAQDLEATIQRMNGQVETLGHDLEEARRNDAAAETDRRLQAQQLNDRLSRIEAQLAALGDAANASDPSLAEGAAPADPNAGPPPGGRGGRDSDATTRAQAEDRGILGATTPAPSSAPPSGPPPVTPADSFAAARALFTSGDHPGAADAFQTFISRYPTNARTPEAYYWLGESYYAQHGFQNATAAYAAALKTRPTTSWAPAAMVRLSQALVQSNQNAQACAAISEFDKRYAARASTTLKTNADAVRKRARCT